MFGVAGRRHFDDGHRLLAAGRHVSADHLAGLAAECIIKAVLVEYLGISMTPSGQPQLPDRTKLGHLPELWSQVATHLGGRGGARFAELLAAANPFARWQVHDRYSDGAGIDEQASRAHLNAAARILAIHEHARLDGALP